jgi:primosomal protein N' (replication factor Y)
VQFGSKKILTGVVVEVHENPPKVHEAKYLLDILDKQPVLNTLQLSLFEWMASYYMCAEGQVLQVALPSGLKLSSQSKIQIHPEYSQDSNPYPLDDQELVLLQALHGDGALDYTDTANILGSKNVHKIIKSLLAKNAIILFEEVKEKYQPKKERRVRLTVLYITHKTLEELFELLQKKPKQTAVLLKYLQQVPVLKEKSLNQKGLSKTQLLSGETSPSSLKTLIKNGVLEEFEVVVSRFPVIDSQVIDDHEIVLTAQQCQARDAILDSFEEKQTVLFHGITGSGKTEIYIDLINKVLKSGSQVLYLLPEIALTTQIVRRLQKIFGNSMGIYHSRFSDNERVEVWRGILEGKFSFIVGVRSAVFLPFDNLGLIIVDEEHELSYKQFDPAPRYHARDVALVLARLHHSKTLLGSATPSIESYYHAQHGKYSLVELDERYRNAALPVYKLIDSRKAHLKKQMKGVFTSELVVALEMILQKGQQAIIFQNRRGYAPYLQCQVCGHIPQCLNCAVTLTYHLHYNQLRYQQIIDQFERGNIDILIGTQMVSKGLDFDKVDLVGVLDIDRAMHFPDFRSHERAFQLITQVGGRAGRRSGKGQVLVQTSNVKHQLLQLISDHNYLQFYQHEIQERAKYLYPPFVRLIRLTVKSPDQELGFRAAQELANRLVLGLGKSRVLGPQEPVISKLRNLYLMELYIKLEKGVGTIDKVKQHLSNELNKLTSNTAYRKVRVIPDVEPY